MTDKFAALRIFVRLAHTGSFSRTARELKLSQPTTSRMISDLEEQLGVTLFTRTTRAVVLTQVGEEYLKQIQPILRALEEADHRIRGGSQLRGVLRVSMASVTASRIVLPRLKLFMAENPLLDIHLSTEDRRQDLIGESIDVALRSGTLPDSSSKARQIGTWPMIMAGAPAYLAEYGFPKLPSDFDDHRFIVAGPAAGQTIIFNKGELKFPVQLNGRLAIQGNEAAVAAGVNGLGLVVATQSTLINEIERGDLVRIMEDWDMGELGVHVIFPGRQNPSPAARAFAEFLISIMADHS